MDRRAFLTPIYGDVSDFSHVSMDRREFHQPIDEPRLREPAT